MHARAGSSSRCHWCTPTSRCACTHARSRLLVRVAIACLCALRCRGAAAANGVPLRAGVDVKTIVNSVPWWPESNLQFEEAVGVVSRDVLFMTGMLAATEIKYSMQHFNTSQLNVELSDVHDIAKAANTSLSSLVDCVTNVPVGGALGCALQLTA